MKKILILIALGSTTLLSADQYSGDYQPNSCNGGSCQAGGRYQYRTETYQNQPTTQTYQGGNEQNSAQPQAINPGGPNQAVPPVKQPANKVEDDMAISSKVNETLRTGWYSKAYGQVTFSVSNGKVTLRGSVDSDEDKRKIESSIKRIDGVKQIDNQIVVGKAAPIAFSDDISPAQANAEKASQKFPQDFAASESDRTLNNKIRDQLNAGWVASGYDSLVLSTDHGVVIISGTVDKKGDVLKIGTQIRSISGVRTVKNELTVKGS